METLSRFAEEILMKLGMLMLCFPWMPGAEVPCLVTEDEVGTLYSVQEFEGYDCLYAWSNGSDYVVANQKDILKEQVVSSNSSALVKRVCSKLMYYSRTCDPEGIEITATCTSNCTSSGRPGVDEGISDWWWCLLLVLPVLLALLVFYICRNQNPKPFDTVNGSDAEGGSAGSSP